MKNFGTEIDFMEVLKNNNEFEEYTFFEMLKQRKILINGEIDDRTVERAIMQIIKFNEEDKDIPSEKRKPIYIYLNTLGGVVDVGLVLCDVIKQSKTPVYVVALAYACSMGALILMSGHKRFAYRFSNILIHDGSVFVSGTTSKAKDHFKFQEEKEECIKDFIISNTRITEDKYQEKYQNEWWMSSKSAKEYGIIDFIIGEDVDMP